MTGAGEVGNIAGICAVKQMAVPRALAAVTVSAVVCAGQAQEFLQDCIESTMDHQAEKPYLLLISIHGLIRGHDLELGRDADTGGQTKYVVDLVKTLAKRDDIGAVDLATRRIVDPDLSDDYAREVEPLGPRARIVRLDCGPPGYVAKEVLWDHLDSFADNLLEWLDQQPRLPSILHSHYADAGYVGVRVSNQTGVPLVHTGHSLGRDKRRQLLAKGHRREHIETAYNLTRRIEAEEEVLANAALVIASTRNEVEEQYELYDYYQPERLAVIPPGTDLRQFRPPDRKATDVRFAKELKRFLRKPDKPMILTLSRPDERKNIVTLLSAYGESVSLRKQANLVIVVGNREDIRDMDSGPQAVLTEILMLIDNYDLYGQVAVPKRHRPAEVAEIYRLAAILGGVFVNPALTEPFGLTLLEAAASGLPLVATENGGPTDIIGACRNGLLVDPLDSGSIARALQQLLGNQDLWHTCARNGLQGVRKHYSWQAHTEGYLDAVRPLFDRREPLPRKTTERGPMHYHDRSLFSDLDQNLLGNPTGLRQLIEVLHDHRRSASFGIATGRQLTSALAVLKKYAIPMPDVLITGLGTEIHYGRDLTADDAWADHIDHLWSPKAVRRLLDGLPGLILQPRREQSHFKVSYHYDPGKAPAVDEINALLRQEEQTVNVIHAFGQFLDIIPVRASKGLALRYFAQQWGIPLERILVAGGSGADEDMMRGNTLAVVVANRHHEELSQLDDQHRIYFAENSFAPGILEAIEYYDFYGTCRSGQGRNPTGSAGR